MTSLGMKRLLLVLAFALLAITTSEARRGRRGSVCSRGYTRQHNWANLESDDPTQRGFMLLTLSWPGSFCESRRCQVVTKINPDFTIHGLWPNYAARGYPSCCDTTPNFPSQITGAQVQQQVYADPELVPRLNDEWPDFNQNNFIAYEFDKHGTCAMDVFDSPRDYIKTVLDLKAGYDFFRALQLTQDELQNGGYRTPSQLHYNFAHGASQTQIISPVTAVAISTKSESVFAKPPTEASSPSTVLVRSSPPTPHATEDPKSSFLRGYPWNQQAQPTTETSFDHKEAQSSTTGCSPLSEGRRSADSSSAEGSSGRASKYLEEEGVGNLN